MLERNWEMMSAVLDAAFADDVGPLARIDRFVDSFARMLTLMREKMGATPGCPLGGLAAELAGQGGDTRTRVTGILNAWARYFVEAIAEAKGRGEVDPGVDATATAMRLLAHLQGLALLARAYDDPQLVLQAKADLPLLLPAPR